jgi:hypothetical protein
MMNVNVQTQTKTRNLRTELRALMRRDLLLPAVVGYETELSPDAISEWLKGAPKSADFNNRIAEFIDSYTSTWEMLALASNATRAVLGLRFLTNIAVVLNEMENAPAARRGELRDVLVGEIGAARRVMELIGVEGGESPERLAATIRSALAPGDTMLIKRGRGDRTR